MEVRFPTTQHLPVGSVPGRRLWAYDETIAEMTALVARPPTAPDLLLCVEHPPTITLGRHRGHESIHGTELRRPGQPSVAVAIHEVPRGGAVTYHAPGQLVIYPIVQLRSLPAPLGGGAVGDLGQYVRTLEHCIVATCARFGLKTQLQPGRSGVWIGERIKLASIGIGVRNGWTFHGLALNVNVDLSGFELITPCGLTGVTMTSVWHELADLSAPPPTYLDVETDLIERLTDALKRS